MKCDQEKGGEKLGSSIKKKFKTIASVGTHSLLKIFQCLNRYAKNFWVGWRGGGAGISNFSFRNSKNPKPKKESITHMFLCKFSFSFSSWLSCILSLPPSISFLCGFKLRTSQNYTITPTPTTPPPVSQTLRSQFSMRVYVYAC